MPATCTDWTAPQRAEGLPPASFGFRLADTLAIGWALPADGRARDFHPLGGVYARYTTEGAAIDRGSLFFALFVPAGRFERPADVHAAHE